MSFTEKNNSGKLPTKDSHNPILVTIYVFCITAHPPMKRNKFFLKKWSSVYLHTVLKFAFYTFIKNKRGLPGAARDYFTISLWNSPVQIDLRTQQALGWGEPPTIKIFMHKPTPRSNFCLLSPAQFSKHTPPFGRVDPRGPWSGWAPRNKNFTIQTHPEEQLLFAGPRLILNPSGFFRWGHYRGYPRGPTFGVTPWLGAEPGWNDEPMPNFRVIGCVGPAAGRRTYTHTHIHTFIFI
jgi:hypothetical protein